MEEFIELYSNGENQDPSLADPDPLPPRVKEGKGSGSARLVTPAGIIYFLYACSMSMMKGAKMNKLATGFYFINNNPNPL